MTDIDWKVEADRANRIRMLEAENASYADDLNKTIVRMRGLEEALRELLRLVEGSPLAPDEPPEEPCEELCGNSWCNEFGCIEAKLEAARAALSSGEAK